MRHRRLPRLASFSYRGKYRYYVTFCTFERQAKFTRAQTVYCVREQILRTLREREFALLAEVFMPDHVHLLVEGLSERACFKPTMTVMRQRATIAYKQQVASGPLWQDGYFDHVLRRDDQIERTARYIVENPVAAGLVDSPDAYPYLSSRFRPELEKFGPRR